MDSEPFDTTTAADVSRNFGHWQDRAMQAPVRVTHHGRPRVVILSAESFERLTHPAESAEVWPPQDAAFSVLDEAAEAFLALDADLRIVRMNRAAETFLGRAAPQLLGRSIEEIEQGGRRGVFAERYRWVLRAGEAVTFEADGYLHPERSLKVRAFPFLGGVGVLMSNRTEVKGLRREREEWRALREALEAHDDIAAATFNVLGFFTSVNAAFAAIVGFSQDRLREARLTDLLVSADRRRVAEGLNTLIQGQAKTFVTDIGILTSEIARRPMRISIAPTMRDMICDGFALITQRSGREP